MSWSRPQSCRRTARAALRCADEYAFFATAAPLSEVGEQAEADRLEAADGTAVIGVDRLTSYRSERLTVAAGAQLGAVDAQLDARVTSSCERRRGRASRRRSCRGTAPARSSRRASRRLPGQRSRRSTVNRLASAGFCAADLVERQPERHRALAHAQRAQRMQHQRLRRAVRACAATPAGWPTAAAARASCRPSRTRSCSSGITAIGGSVVSRASPQVTSKSAEIEKNRKLIDPRPLSPPRRRPLEREGEIDAEQPDAERP